MHEKNIRFAYGAIFFIALSTLMFEVILTRIFSVMLWYHFAYVIISIAMLGLGASGTFLALAKFNKKDQSGERTVALFAAALPLVLIYCFLLSTRIQVHPLQIVTDKSNIFSLFAIYSLLTIPFFVSGVCIGFLLTRDEKHVGRLYFWDLLGAGIGSIMVMLSINFLNAPAAVMVAAVMSAIGSILFARMASNRWAMPPVWIALTTIAVFCVFLNWNWDIKVPRSKELYYYQEHNETAWQKWTTVARVDVSQIDKRYTPSFGGEVAPAYRQDKYNARFITQDGIAPTLFFTFDGTPADALPFLPHTTQSGAYLLKNSPKVLTIGIGGGIDILVALAMGAQSVTAVEINPAMVELTTRRFARENSNALNDPRIQWVVEEGRHYLASSKTQYDIIQMSGVDTFAALSSGAYVLSESYLYTREAVNNVYDRLTEDGIYSVSRFYFEDKPRETLRLAATMLEVLGEQGAENPTDHLFVLRGNFWATILMKKSPWSTDELESLAAFCDENEFQIIFNPANPPDNIFSAYLTMSPTERQDFERDYPYHLTAATDDRPFFFQFLKWSSYLGGFKEGQKQWGYFITRIPVAYQTLLVTLSILLGLSLLLILLPLYAGGAGLKNVPGRWSVLLYFSMLGLGFIFVEIVLVQKLIIYLGNPLYSISLILAGLLMFSGVGAGLTSRAGDAGRAAKSVGLIVAIIILAEAFLIPLLTRSTLHLPMTVRWSIIMLTICPLGIFMGMPFPLGIRLAARLDESLLPWAWGINACLTVIGTMLAIFMSTLTGFNVVFIVASGLYLVAAGAAALMARKA